LRDRKQGFVCLFASADRRDEGDLIFRLYGLFWGSVLLVEGDHRSADQRGRIGKTFAQRFDQSGHRDPLFHGEDNLPLSYRFGDSGEKKDLDLHKLGREAAFLPSENPGDLRGSAMLPQRFSPVDFSSILLYQPGDAGETPVYLSARGFVLSSEDVFGDVDGSIRPPS